MSKKSNNENAYAILEAGETYQFAGYRWVPVEINENCHVAVMQSLGVTAGPWPGFSMENLGDGKHYAHNIDEYDISRYDDKTYALMKQIKPVSFIDGLYLPGLKILMTTSYGKMLLREQQVVTVRSAHPTATLGLVLTTATATARGSSTRTATPTTTIRTIRMLSLPLLISTYPKLRLLVMKLSS